MTFRWAKGQPADGLVIPTICNCDLPDGALYQMRQMTLFGRGAFGFVPVTLLRPEDQIFPDLGRASMRTVVLAGQAWNSADFYVELEHAPDIEPDRVKDSTYHDPAERVFARRPSLDEHRRGLYDVVLELPADMDSDGNLFVLTPQESVARRAALLATVKHRWQSRVDTALNLGFTASFHVGADSGFASEPLLSTYPMIGSEQQPAVMP